MSAQTLKIGTRKSVMALAQTEGIARLLRAADPALDVEIVKFETRGDQDQTSKLLRHGGKGGAFVAEIRDAMRAGRIAGGDAFAEGRPRQRGNARPDHRARPCRATRPTTRWCCVPVFLWKNFGNRTARASKIGTNAVRRAAYLRRLFPEATVIHYRGAADTRVAKLDRGDKQRLPDGGEVGPADALVMARSGLERIGHDVSASPMIFRCAKCCRRWGRASSRSNASSRIG